MAEAPEAEPTEEPAGGGLAKDVRNWAMLCHLAALAGYVIPFAGNVIGPLVVWLLKREEHAFINDQGKEAVNFQITMTIAYVASAVLVLVVIGIVLLPLVALFSLIMMIVAAVKTSSGVQYRYPLCIRFLK